MPVYLHKVKAKVWFVSISSQTELNIFSIKCKCGFCGIPLPAVFSLKNCLLCRCQTFPYFIFLIHPSSVSVFLLSNSKSKVRNFSNCADAVMVKVLFPLEDQVGEGCTGLSPPFFFFFC